jgi:outer membrane protein assembly factor BamB
MSEWGWFAPDADLTRMVRVGQGAGGGLASIPAFSGGSVWIGGSHNLVCADPATGQVQASATIPTDNGVVEYFSSVAVVGGRGYALYLDQAAHGSLRTGVVTLTPPAACGG